MPTSASSSGGLCTGALEAAIREKISGVQVVMKEVKLSLVTEGVVFHVEEPM